MGVRRRGAVAAAVVSALALAGEAGALPRCEPLVRTGGGPLVTTGDGPLVATGDEPVIKTGDIDLLEDVLEHISVPFGEGSGAPHQVYGQEAQER
ncbi:hypothetical protein ACIBI4_30495 [Streptomyces sp. NPDC050418]|uniref:hypothetical protein n=1 Tax=Streptomyces sp. NPDC050418 TaxID=3365612 RepID=UPI0037A8AC5D